MCSRYTRWLWTAVGSPHSCTSCSALPQVHMPSCPELMSRVSMEASAAADDSYRDWSAVPAGALQNIFTGASTWQSPGSCRAAPVCRSWRAAAAGCKDIRLLYTGRGGSKQAGSLALWLERNSHKLQSLLIGDDADEALGALAAAAAAAWAAGAPLPLHPVRVFEWRSAPVLDHISALLGTLPDLCILQAGMDNMVGPKTCCASFEEQMAPLGQATQLQELYWSESDMDSDCNEALCKLLPHSLKRLGWTSGLSSGNLDVAALTQLTFLQLVDVDGELGPLPPSCEVLELVRHIVSFWDVARYHQVLARVSRMQLWDLTLDEDDYHVPSQLLDPTTLQADFSCLSKLGALAVDEDELSYMYIIPAMEQLTALSALVVKGEGVGVRCTPTSTVRALLSTPQYANGLRRLDLEGGSGGIVLSSVALLSQLTWLRFSQVAGVPHPVVTEQLGRLPHLKWLSVPGVLLNGGHGWLGGLQQLRVLVLTYQVKGRYAWDDKETEKEWVWLAADSPLLLPPRLLVLGCEHSARPYVKPLVAGSGCEVVDADDLHAACDPTQQLAGLPEALQQALG